jgi:hypothetical protein
VSAADAGNVTAAVTSGERSMSIDPTKSDVEVRSVDLVFAREVRDFRQRAIDNGYDLVRVRSQSKRPLPHEWQHGDKPDLLLTVRQDALNTGLLLGGLRCIDCDVDDPQVVDQIMAALLGLLPERALIRRRANSPRVAMLYRAAEGQPGKRVIAGSKGKVEVLGLGQQAVVHGLHPSGAAITWLDERGPDTVRHDEIPAVSEDQLSELFNVCAPLLGANAASVTRLPRTNKPPERLAETSSWFGKLARQGQSEAVKYAALHLANNSALFELTKYGGNNDEYFKLALAIARSGVPNAEDIFVEAASTAKDADPEEKLRKDFQNYECAEPRDHGVTVGTLLLLAQQNGANFDAWKRPAPNQPPLPPGKRKPRRGGTYSGDEALELLNSHYLIGKSDQEVAIFRIKDDGSLAFAPPEQFRLDVGNIFVEPAGGSAKPTPVEKFWKEHPHRHERAIVFKPGGTTQPDEFNLWRGYGVEPRKGWQNQRRLLRHIWKIICRRDRGKFRYFIRWLAWAVKNPDKHSEVVIVLKSRKQGTGKSTVGAVMLEIFGPHGALVDDKDRLLGRFNDWLETTSFVLGEEIMWAGDHKSTDKLKSMITASTIQVERKNGAIRQITNRLHPMMTTNHDHAVAAGVGDRRNVVFDVSDDHACDEAWFGPLYRDLEAGGTSEFLWFLQNIGLGDWHPRQIIKTAEATEQQRMSADTVSQWLRACIDADAIIGNSGRLGAVTHDLGKPIAFEKLREAYAGYCRQQGLRAVNVEVLGKACTEMFGPRKRLPVEEYNNRRPWGYDVPDGSNWQAKLDERLGIKK